MTSTSREKSSISHFDIASDAPSVPEDIDRKETDPTHFATWLWTDPEIRAWLMRRKIAEFPNLHKFVERKWLKIQRRMVLLTRLLGNDSRQRSTILERVSFQSLLDLSEDMVDEIEELLVADPHHLAAGELAVLFCNGPTEGAATWGERIRSLDVLSYFTRRELGTPQKYEYLLAQAFPHLITQPGADVLATYLANGRNLAYHTRNTPFLNEQVSTVRTELPKQEPELYQRITDLESPLDPRHRLLPLIGIEIEAHRTRDLGQRVYDRLEKYVIYRGATKEFEFSAAPVRHAETLKTVYQRLLETGYLDLFWMTNYSTHWNANVSGPKLFIESLAGLALTGYFTDGRVGSSIREQVYSNSSKLGQYWEWKQGDLYHPEQLLIAIDVFHAVVTAQKNYEKVSWSLSRAGKEVSAETIEEVADASHEEKQLALIYWRYRTQMQQVFQVASLRGIVGVKDFVQGTPAGMQRTTQLLMAVYPNSTDILQKPLKANRRVTVFSRRAAIAEKVVGQAQQLAANTVDDVNEVLAICYDDYIGRLHVVASEIVKTWTAKPQKKVLRLFNYLMSNQEDAQLPRSRNIRHMRDELTKRLEYGLHQSGIDAETQALYLRAIHKLNSFWKFDSGYSSSLGNK